MKSKEQTQREWDYAIESFSRNPYYVFRTSQEGMAHILLLAKNELNGKKLKARRSSKYTFEIRWE